MKKVFKRNFIRKDKKILMLFGYKEHDEQSSVELESTESLLIV